jgi:hypothetical protein
MYLLMMLRSTSDARVPGLLGSEAALQLRASSKVKRCSEPACMLRTVRREPGRGACRHWAVLWGIAGYRRGRNVQIHNIRISRSLHGK